MGVLQRSDYFSASDCKNNSLAALGHPFFVDTCAAVSLRNGGAFAILCITFMSFDPERITYFAKTDARGASVPFGIRAKDRQRHMYVIGKTGMGKSTLLENMAAQDIINGEGMAFIDPHGSAAETLLEYIPEHRVKDVVYFAPFDMDNPIAFNVMEDVGADKRHLVVSGLMSTFKKIWVDAWSARMEYILTNALLALIEYPDTTLLSVNRMLADKEYRDKVVKHIKDPAVKAYWVDEFASYTERFAAEALPAIQNKIGQFTGNPLIRNIIGQPKSSFDIRKMMDEKKILIVNLSKGLVGETNADLLGSMLTTRIYLAAMSRADLPVMQMKQMPNFYFYVDEFQSFANATFANILSEARKYHLNLIIAHQYIEQMEEDVRNAVFGNVGTTVAFRVGPFDAEHLEKIFEPKFMATDLVNLGMYQIYLTLMIDGIGSQPFSATTLPPVELPQISYKDMAIAASRRQFTNKRDVVEQIVNELHASEKMKNGGSSNNAPNRNNGNRKQNVKNNERPKPNFENTILSKLREQNGNSAPNTNSKPEVKREVKPEIETEEKIESKANKTEAAIVPKKDIKPTTEPGNLSDKSLDELRSILKKISVQENRKDEPSKSKSPRTRRPERNTKRKNTEKSSSAGPGDLKSALAAAVDSKTASNQANTPPPPKKENRDTEPAPLPKKIPQPETDEIKPQDLERMMRVNSNEKPPLS